MLDKKEFLLACLLHDFGKFVKFGCGDNNEIKENLGIDYRQINDNTLEDSH
jgi:HD superfamily phosphodiesterase